MAKRNLKLERLLKDGITRTILYKDQKVSELELELWHTSVFQRLYFIRQLGFSDKVFPDAVHNRFNHVIGVCQRAEDILVAAAEQTSPKFVPHLADSIKPRTVSEYILSRIDVGRLMALLHDLAHIPFGHTLEDELHLFATKHDQHSRQVKLFNRITSQFIWGLYDDVIGLWPQRWSRDVSSEQLNRHTEELLELSEKPGSPNKLLDLGKFLTNLSAAQVALVTMHHGYEKATNDQVQLFLPKLLPKLNIDAEFFHPQRDQFLIDAIGNTICADLLDYSRRDMRMASMSGDYDDRLFKWFVLAETSRGTQDVTPGVNVAIPVLFVKRIDPLSANKIAPP